MIIAQLSGPRRIFIKVWNVAQLPFSCYGVLSVSCCEGTEHIPRLIFIFNFKFLLNIYVSFFRFCWHQVFVSSPPHSYIFTFDLMRPIIFFKLVIKTFVFICSYFSCSSSLDSSIIRTWMLLFLLCFNFSYTSTSHYYCFIFPRWCHYFHFFIVNISSQFSSLHRAIFLRIFNVSFYLPIASFHRLFFLHIFIASSYLFPPYFHFFILFLSSKFSSFHRIFSSIFSSFHRRYNFSPYL